MIVALTFTLAKHFRLSWTFALLASISFLIILCLPSSFIYYFRFGLIEPVAVLCLMLTFFFAIKHRKLEMTLAAILTVLLRSTISDSLSPLSFFGLIPSSEVFPPHGHLWPWMMRSLKPMLTYALMVVVPPLFIVAAYYVFIPNYMLSASDVSQSSFLSLLDGFMRVLLGGNFNDFREKLAQASFEFLLIVLPLASGFLISMLSIFHRRGSFCYNRLAACLACSIHIASLHCRTPSRVFPAFSFPILALDILLTAMFLHFYLKKNEAVSDT